MATIYIRNNMIQISVNVDGKQYRKSTGLKNTRANKKKVEEEILPKFMAKITEPTKDIILDCIRRPHSDSQPINIRTLSRS
jgi:integrase